MVSRGLPRLLGDHGIPWFPTLPLKTIGFESEIPTWLTFPKGFKRLFWEEIPTLGFFCCPETREEADATIYMQSVDCGQQQKGRV
jgi:hypothetical protein